MLVNSADILTTYKAKLLSKDIQTAEIVIFDDWLRNSLNPLYLGKQEKFKKINLEFVIVDTTDDNCLTDISNLVSQLKRCILKFDDIDFYYNCTIVSAEHERLVELGYFKLTVELKSGYAYLPEVTETMNHVLTKSITVLGNLPSPAIVTITAPINTVLLIFTGFSSSITVNDLLANVPVIIDGELGTTLQNGSNKFVDVDMWEFPVLQPGANTITVNSNNCVVTIVYKPKYI